MSLATNLGYTLLNALNLQFDLHYESQDSCFVMLVLLSG